MGCDQRCLAVTGDKRPQLRLHRSHSGSAWWALPGCAVAAGVLCWCSAVSHPGTLTPEQTPRDHLALWGTHRHTDTRTREGKSTAAWCTHTHSRTHLRTPHPPTHTFTVPLTLIPTYRAPLDEPARGSPWVLCMGSTFPACPPVSPPVSPPPCPCPEAGSGAGSAAAAPWTAPAPLGQGAPGGGCPRGPGGVPRGYL